MPYNGYNNGCELPKRDPTGLPFNFCASRMLKACGSVVRLLKALLLLIALAITIL
jgi:hypothetical protein